jgi:hypothetical protein
MIATKITHCGWPQNWNPMEKVFHVHPPSFPHAELMAVDSLTVGLK